jgi:hypothetical protein
LAGSGIDVHGEPNEKEHAMQRLTLKRRASGIHAVHAPDGEALGVVNVGDLDLDDDELSTLMKKQADKKAAAGAVDEFLKKINDHVEKAGVTYGEATVHVSRQEPLLASEYRRRVLSGR